MTWNYRLLRHANSKADIEWYAIHEVYYDDDGNPWLCTENGIDVSGETQNEAFDTYRTMAEAFRLPILEYEKFHSGGYAGNDRT